MQLKLLATLAFLLLSSVLNVSCKTDESPGFFLKLAKNVPRIGRRADKDFENYFSKNSKLIPRMGRATENSLVTDPLMTWLNDVPQPSKRKLMYPPTAYGGAEREYSVVQPVNSNTLMELIEKDAIQSDRVKFVHWKDFDRALQLDLDLYDKVISLGRKPDLSLRHDLGFSSYAPFLGNSLDGGTDVKFYNRASNEMYPYQYDRDLLHYDASDK